MSPKMPPKSDNPAESKRFIEAARETHGDKSEGGAKHGLDKFIRGARPKGPCPKQKDSRS
jgi:hypothetical protein